MATSNSSGNQPGTPPSAVPQSANTQPGGQTASGPAGTPAGSATPDTPDTPKNNKRRARILLGLLIVAVVIGLVWLFHWWTVGRFIETTDDAYLRADSVTISPKISGYVQKVFVGDNATVRAGQPLVELDVRQYQASLDQSNATIDARKADIAKGQADIAQQEASIAQAKAQAEASRVSYEHAAGEYARFAPLAATGAETGQRLADLRSTRDQARATYDANLAAVKAANAQITTIRAQIAQAQAQLEASVASARNSGLDLHDTIVRSPIDGRVGDRTVRVGQYLQPGTKTMTVVPTLQTYLVANYKETQLAGMRVGQPAILHVDAMPGVELHGVVDSFAPGTGSEFALLPPENATGNFTKIVQRVPVRIRINADLQTRSLLLPGMSVTVDVDTSVHPQDQQDRTAANVQGGAASAPAAASDSGMPPMTAPAATSSAAAAAGSATPSGAGSAANHG